METIAEPPNTPEAEVTSDFLDFAKARQRIDHRISSWSDEISATKKRRKERYIKLDIEDLRARKIIEDDETFIPTRIIDSNITREKADAMNFLNAANRLIYFRCVDDPNVDSRQLDSDVTKGLTYPGWYSNFSKHFDGAALHGSDSHEIMYDEGRPLRVSFEHIGHENLLYNRKIKNIQDDEFILRRYESVTMMKLLDFVTDYGFDQDQVYNLTNHLTQQRQDDTTFTLYKVFFKFQKCVYVAWYAKEPKASSWLKQPQKLSCGILKQEIIEPEPTQLSIGAGIEQASIVADNVSGDENTSGISSAIPVQPAPITLWVDEETYDYPVRLFVYRDDEQQCISDHVGRGFLDLPQQEAVTAVKTGFVNQILKAANIFASPAEPTDDSMEMKWLDLPVVGNRIANKKLEFWSFPNPDPMVLTTLQYLSTDNSISTGKMAVAVSNRKDSRKTAKELDLASGEEQKITSTGLADYSEYLRSVFDFSWLIIRSQALAGNIVLLPIESSDPISGEVKRTNNIAILSKKFDIRAAGEIDVIQKEKELQTRREDWPVVQGTALAGAFLSDYIRLQYPTYAEKYIKILEMGDQAKMIIQSLLTVIGGSLQPEEIKGNEAQLQQVIGTAQAYLAGPQLQGAAPAQQQAQNQQAQTQ